MTPEQRGQEIGEAIAPFSYLLIILNFITGIAASPHWVLWFFVPLGAVFLTLMQLVMIGACAAVSLRIWP